jgi:murein DD-endopeptidase MepM/ murein hydrolase activator NlpD
MSTFLNKEIFHSMVTKPWHWPLAAWSFRNVPTHTHPGAFAAKRKHDVHTGVDLYCPSDTEVFAVEDGRVVAVEHFTGPQADDPSPWWKNTWAVLVEGESGVVLYGELYPHVEVGDDLKEGKRIGFSRSVLKKDKGKPMCMLHLELYTRGTKESVWWKLGEDKPKELKDPTSKLLYSFMHIE